MKTIFFHLIRATYDPIAPVSDQHPMPISWVETRKRQNLGLLFWMIGVAVICCLGATAFGQSPVNDNFANAQSITGTSGSAAGTNLYATLESGEPTTTAGFTGGNSVWFQWEAPSSDSFTFVLAAGFDSQLAIYTGSTVGSLTSEGENDPGGLGGDTVVIAANAGWVYQIRVTGYSSQSGSFTLNWLPTPPNDNFADAQTLNLYNGAISLNATNVGATVESGEASSPGLPVQSKSVWYQLFISADATITVSTAGSSFDTTLSIFRRSSPGIGGLVSVTGNDNSPPLVTSEVTFSATRSVGVYYIAVGGGGGAQGSITLSVTSSAAQPNPISGQGYERLVSFPDLRVAGLPNRGAVPEAQLTSASNGFLYGTTSLGGENGHGTVFKMSAVGQLTTLVEFTGVTGNRKGSGPAASLLEASDGNFYGTTSGGGANSFGTVFRMSPAGSFTTLFEFTGEIGAVKGASPATAMVQAADGTFYGTTSSGGQYGLGTVFRILHDGTFQTLVEFSGSYGPFSGAGPTGLVAAVDGGVYGTFYQRDPTTIFGAGGGIFRITSTGAYSEVHSFQASGGGYAPLGLNRGPGGAFYGVTAYSLARDIYESDYPPTVFKYTPGGSFETLKTFSFFTGVGGGLCFDEAGNLFGFTNQHYGSLDTIYKIAPSGSFETVVDFSSVGRGGWGPAGGLVRGVDGNLFGVTTSGGFQNAGTVFRLSPTSEITTMLEFSDRGFIDKGQDARSGLVEHPNGFLYGTTSSGGNNDAGVIFKIAGDGTITKLVDFSGMAGPNRGALPSAELIVASDGNFYGTTNRVGKYQNEGTVFKMTPEGVFESLLSFTGSGGVYPGYWPNSSLIEAHDGLLYGTTESGDSMFRLAKNGSAFENLESSLLFGPKGALLQDAQGNFFGCIRYGGADQRGSIYRRTSAGVLQTVAEFGQIADGAAGYYPAAGLVQATDGKFYGTASGGGLFGFGTVYRVSANGDVETVVSFMGPDGPRRGANPAAGLKAGANGWYYGTTSSGGIGNQGTLYRLKISGEFETLLDFAYYSVDGAPVGELLFGSDGNVYGARSDALFRLVLPGPPMIYSFEVVSSPNGDAVIQGKVNPRGSACSVVVEYGEDAAISFPETVTLHSDLTGGKTTLVGRTLGSLEVGKRYFYRVRASNGNGVDNLTVGPIKSFTTVGTPMPRVTAASEIGTNGAQLNGMVDARYSNTTVSFEIGTDGNVFEIHKTADPATISGEGDGEFPVEYEINDLAQGVTYYYRVVATNAGGTQVSGMAEFSTLASPVAHLVGAEALSTTRAKVNGTVDPRGSMINEILFQYGVPDETGNVGDDQWLPANASPSTANGPGPVTATLTGLSQGTTYLYRIRASGPGGTGFSETSTFRLSHLSGLVQVFPDPPPPSNGTVTVNFDPPTRGGWRFEGETSWRSSGDAADHLASGQRVIEFLPIAGYVSPPAEILDVTSVSNIALDRLYYNSPTAGTGALTVRLKPEGLGGQWQFVGETIWRDSGGVPVTGLAAGNYLIHCKALPVEAGYTTPPNASVTVANGDSRELTLTYFTENTTGGTPPLPLDFDSVSANEDLPFAYMGQIRSEVGSSSGFVVKRRVVATAGHVVFDDGTLSSITRLQWLFQRHAGENEPKPQEPRGYYLAAGYASQRIADNSPGEGSPQSQHLDYAALYFLEEAGRGGSGGFLATEAGDDNEFLSSTAEKILAGYAVDGVPATDQGKLHATAAFSAALAPAFGETWTTTAVRGLGGCSGGPLFVRHASGAYFPAAIYLGGSGQTVVRAIDNDVVDLFLRAEVSGNGGDNNTGGGITHTGVTTFSTTATLGAIKVTILPAAAASAGRWGLKGEPSNRQSESTSSGRSADDYILQLTTISGFQAPTPQTVHITGGQLTEITFTYAAEAPPPAITSASSKTGTRGQSLSYQIVTSESPTSYTLTGSLPTGLTFNTGSGLISGTLQQAGVFVVTLGATNASGTGTKALTITSRPSVSNRSTSVPLGQPMAWQIPSSESGPEVSYSADDLPQGVDVNPETGLISGTPLEPGVFISLITVSKDGASASAILTLTVTGTALQTWRFEHFGSTSNSGDGANSADPDGDGSSNLDEYAAGTNPKDTSDVFRILTAQKTGNVFIVTTGGRSGRTYALQRRADLAPGIWTVVTTIGPLVFDGPVALTDISAPPNNAFYRIQVSIP